MRFSERLGFKTVKTAIQKDNIDDDLRNTLWSALKIFYWDKVHHSTGTYGGGYYLSGFGNEEINLLCNRLWLHYYKKPLDTLSNNWTEVLKQLRQYFFSCPWFDVYDFIEFVANSYPAEDINKKFIQTCNAYLEREKSAYRFIDKKISPVVAEEEIASIEEALQLDIEPVRKHINTSLSMLSDRKKPDYRNSVKESISAVEAVARVTTGDEKATLGKLLKKLEREKGLHIALRDGFEKLYGYTSDEGGIRHSLIDPERVTFDDAKFMLVICSAFVNYVNSVLNVDK